MKGFYLCLLAALFAGAWSANPAAAAEPSAKSLDPRAVIARKFPGVKVENVRPSPIGGVYEVVMGADTAYVSADGRYIIAGDMYEIDTRKNLSEARRVVARVKTLSKLDEREMIVFAPAKVKHTITVFTDVECAYCRKLHSHIDELNRLGVKVRYLAYPRAGPNTADLGKMEAVWCAKDRQAAITQAKLGQPVKSERCTTPVAKQYQLGEDMGVQGTPAIFTTDGDYIAGYMPPAELVKELDQLKAARARE